MSYGFASYGMPQTYSVFSAYPGPSYGTNFPPYGIMPGRYGVGLWRPGFVAPGYVYGASYYYPPSSLLVSNVRGRSNPGDRSTGRLASAGRRLRPALGRAPCTAGDGQPARRSNLTRSAHASDGTIAGDRLRMIFPPLARVRQSIPQPRLEDVPGTVRRLIRTSRLRERVAPGGTIAVGIGSRGVNGIALVARTIVDTLREMGYKPFIVAAMGSHGGATAEGQRELLAGYGVTAEAMGVPVKTDMDTVVLGTNPVGLPIYFDKNAYEADGIVLANRVKPHTDFHATHESGVLKMLVIGLGKREGASQVHKLGVRGLREVLPAVGRFLVKNTRFALGLAIVENAEDVPAEIVAARARDDLRRRAGLARASPRPDGPAAVRPDRRPGRRRAGQELLGRGHGPERHRPVAGRDSARLRPARGHPAGRARRLGREPRQHRRRRLRRSDDRAAGLQAGPRVVPDQRRSPRAASSERGSRSPCRPIAT